MSGFLVTPLVHWRNLPLCITLASVRFQSRIEIIHDWYADCWNSSVNSPIHIFQQVNRTLHSRWSRRFQKYSVLFSFSFQIKSYSTRSSCSQNCSTYSHVPKVGCIWLDRRLGSVQLEISHFVSPRARCPRSTNACRASWAGQGFKQTSDQDFRSFEAAHWLFDPSKFWRITRGFFFRFPPQRRQQPSARRVGIAAWAVSTEVHGGCFDFLLRKTPYDFSHAPLKLIAMNKRDPIFCVNPPSLKWIQVCKNVPSRPATASGLALRRALAAGSLL